MGNIETIAKQIIDKHAPLIKKRVRGKDCQWISIIVRSKMNERDYYLKRAWKSGKKNDCLIYCRLRNTVTRMVRHIKATYTRSSLRENIDRLAQFWNQIKLFYPAKSRNHRASKVFEIKGELMDNQQQIANGFCKFFSNIGRNYGPL